MSLPPSAISRVTGVNVEFRDFNVGTAYYLPQRLAVFGVGNTDAVYTTQKYESTGSASAVGDRYGYGSPLHLAARQLFPDTGAGATFPVTFYPLQKATGSAAAAGSIGAIGTATAAGSGMITIGGITVEFAIAKNQTAAEILPAMRLAVLSKLEMPVTAGEISEGAIPLTAKWSGQVGNLIDIAVESEVPGITFEITAMTGGALDPEITPALTAIGEIWETAILSCFAYNLDSRNDLYETFGEGRWSELEKKPLIVFHGCTDDYATRTAYTDTRKTDRVNALIVSVGSKELPFVIAANAMLNDILTTANANPPQNYKGLLKGLKAGPDSAQENYGTRNNAIQKGSSTNIKNGSVAELNDTVTFYHPDNEPNPAYRYVVDIVRLQNIVYNVRVLMESDQMKGAPLVSDTTVTSNRTAIQPKTIRTMLMNLANSLALSAIIQESEFTKKYLSVKISSQNPKRVDVVFPSKLSGNIEVTSTDILFGFYLEAA